MAGKDSNGMVISLSIFALLSVGLGIAWYFTWSHSDTLQTQLATAQKSESDSKSIIQSQIEEVTKLKSLIGRDEPVVDDLVTKAKEEITKRSGEGASVELTMHGALDKVATDRGVQEYSSSDRMAQLQAKIAEFDLRIKSHEVALGSMKDALTTKEAELLDKERTHAEQLGDRETQIDTLKSQLTKLQDDFATYRTNSDRVTEELGKENLRQREALITLRRDKFKLEGFSFERPDGTLTFVDQNSLTCYLDIGERDELRVGATFSVYKKNNSGVGRSQSDKDLKGKIEIVGLIGDHVAEASIVEQDLDDPLANGDPIYSPIFFPGQKLEIAVVGGLEFDGNPGSDREEFQRIIAGAGAEIVLQVSDEAKLIDRNGTEVSSADIGQLITSKTRFLLVGDLGDENTEDTTQKAINTRIREHHKAMKTAAENNGVYLLNLSSFLDYIGYSRKRLVWTPTSKFPGVLANGAKSLGVNTTLGSRQSSAAISGAYSSGLKAKRKPSQSMGATTGLYRNTNGNEQ